MKIEDIYGSLPKLNTPRLKLRKVSEADKYDLFAYASNDEVTKYVMWDTHKSMADTEGFISYAMDQYKNKNVAPWAIEYKETGKFIGTIDFVWWKPAYFSAEIGYVISPEYWGKGITTEAAKAIIQFGFEKMELVRIQARCFDENIASARVMEKVGMIYEGTHRKEMYIKGRHRDIRMYSILREDFLK